MSKIHLLSLTGPLRRYVAAISLEYGFLGVNSLPRAEYSRVYRFLFLTMILRKF